MKNDAACRTAQVIIAKFSLHADEIASALDLVEQESGGRGADDWERLAPAALLLRKLLHEEGWSLWLLQTRLLGVTAIAGPARSSDSSGNAPE